jgi:hypothetical protein
LLAVVIVGLPIAAWAQWSSSGGTTSTTDNVGIGTTSPNGALDVRGRVCISASSQQYACPNSYTQPGSLTIGDYGSNYGGSTGGWVSNTAGLLLEAQDNTEIAVHDYATRVASLMYFEGGSENRITIGRDMGFGAISAVAINGNVTVSGNIAAKYQDIAEWVPSREAVSNGNGPDSRPRPIQCSDPVHRPIRHPCCGSGLADSWANPWGSRRGQSEGRDDGAG